MTWDGRIGRGTALAGAFGGIVFAMLASSGTSRSANVVVVQKDAKPEWIGASVCQRCHQEKDPTDVKEYQQTRGFDFVRLWENRIWDAHDLHSMAYKNLTTNATKDNTGGDVNATAQRMEDNLKRLRGDKYTVAGDTACLACHASSQNPLDKATFADAKADFFKTDDGVGCEMCHGHGSKYRDEHQRSMLVKGKVPAGEATREVPWRNADPKTKADAGLVNLRDPAVAAAKCASCHVGNKDEGRFVTHEMYAVGHPPLPPLDLMAYSREQPRHWGLSTEMPFLVNLAKKDAKKAFDTFHYRDGESLVARRFVESTIGALRSNVKLVKQLADEAKPKNDGLDFAAFDCYSCHHNLKYPSDRQARGYDGPPGRPQFRLAPFAMARLVADDEKLAGELDTLQKQLAMSFGNRTYGDPDLVIKAVEKLDAWCDAAHAKVAAVRYTKDEVKKLLDKLTAAASREPIAEPRGVPASQRAVADPELAMLYVWAITTLLLDDAKDGVLPANVATLRDGLKGTVPTRLRPNSAYDFEVKINSPAPKGIENVDARIGARMKEFNAFEGPVFRGAFKKLK